jgi:hypothetical protein
MKKLKNLFIVFMLVTTMVYAQVEPTLTDIGDIPQTSYVDVACWSDGIDVFCTGGDEDSLIRQYDVSEGTWNGTGGDTGIYTAVVENGDGCNYYNGYVFCADQNGASTTGMFIFNHTGSGYTTTDFVKAPYKLRPRCDLRPYTDEIWCWSSANAGSSAGNVIIKYDIGDDTWTEIANVNFEGASKGLDRHRCIFINENELWCIAGSSEQSPTDFYNNIMVYNVATDTSDQTRTFDSMQGDSHLCWSHLDCNEIIYCTAQYNDLNDPVNWITENIYWYNTGTDENGILTTTFPYPISIPALAKAGNVVYTFGGYVNDTWDIGQDIFEIDFGDENPVCPDGEEAYTPQHSASDITGLVVDGFVEVGIQFVSFVGLIVVVGLVVWILNLIR